MNNLSKYLYITELVLFPLLAVSTWLASIYGLDVHCLIDVQGVRWILTTLISNMERLPLAELILVLVVSGTFVESGFLRSLFSRRHTIRQLRALAFSGIAFVMLTVAILGMTFRANSVLLGVFGDIQSSPLLVALPGMGLGILQIVSVVYGFSSGKFVTFDDLMASHVVYIRRFAPFIIHFFLLGQLWFWIRYAFGAF